MKNYGVNLKREYQDRQITDWKEGELTTLGAKIPKCIVDEATGLVTASFAWALPVNGIYKRVKAGINHCWCFWQEKWAKYFPAGQIQNNGGEKMDCVTRGFNNEIEKKLNYALDKKILSVGLLEFFHNYGFFHEGKIRLSNRIPAMGSNTTVNGNSLKAPIQWIHKYGIFPQSILPEDMPMTFNQYHDKSKITQDILAIGQESKKYLTINYTIVKGVRNYPKYSNNFKWKIFDNYIDTFDGDFVKQLAPNYIIMNYGYKIIINETGFEPIKPVNEENMLKTIKCGTDERIIIPSNTKKYEAFHFIDPDSPDTSWAKFSELEEHGLIAKPEIVSESIFASYKILPLKVHGTYTVEQDTNPFSSLINSILKWLGLKR